MLLDVQVLHARPCQPSRRDVNNGLWSGSYRIQNALVIQHDGIPKVLCAFFMTDRKDYWNPKQKRWEGRQSEAHISVCSTVPPHVSRLRTPGARADDRQWV